MRPVSPSATSCACTPARADGRRWPAEHFAAVADALADEGVRVVLTGTEAERPITAAVASAMTAPALDLTGRTDLGSLAALLGRARLLVSNDTGVSHLAAATRTPSVVIFSGSEPARWAPLDGERHRALYELRDGELQAVPPERVVREAVAALQETRAYAA